MTDLSTDAKRNINTFAPVEKKQLIRSIYNHSSYFQDYFKQDALDFACAELSLALREHIELRLLEQKIIAKKVPLEYLHEHINAEMRAYNFNDGVNKLSTHFYDMPDTFQAVYFKFIKYLRENFLTEPFYFQATPTIRIHCPNAENSHHYPRYHSDISYGHPPEEMNIWLPLTEIIDNHGFRMLNIADSNFILQELDYDFDKFIEKAIQSQAFSQYCDSYAKPVMTPFGKLCAFDSRCLHTGEPMTTHTRASIDIRLLPCSQYEKMSIQYQGSGRRRILFAPGFCYFHMDSDQLLKS